VRGPGPELVKFLGIEERELEAGGGPNSDEPAAIG
jgi:hypothetical protein